MKNNIILFLSFIAIIFIGCKKDEQIPAPTPLKVLDSIEIITDTMSIDLFPITCIDPTALDSCYVIKNNTEYNNFLKLKMKTPKCDTFQLPAVDFNYYSVIGYTVHTNKFPTPDIYRTIYKYNYLNKIVYKIKTVLYYEKIHGGPAAVHSNLIRIPKIPAGFVVEFETTLKVVNI